MYINIVFYFLHVIGIKKRDPFCEPIASSDAWQLDYLQHAADYFRLWHNAGGKVNGLTSETALANSLTFEAVVKLARYLINQKKLNTVLLGKFGSDVIEKRFGWFRQLSGANFYVSVKQILEAEKRIRVLGLIKADCLSLCVRPSDCNIQEVDKDDSVAEIEIKLTPVSELQISDVEGATIYYVAGYAGKSVCALVVYCYKVALSTEQIFRKVGCATETMRFM